MCHWGRRQMAQNKNTFLKGCFLVLDNIPLIRLIGIFWIFKKYLEKL